MQEHNSIEVFLEKVKTIVVKNKKLLLYGLILSTVLSIILMFVLPKKFKAELVLIPASSQSTSRSILYDRLEKTQDVTSFGDRDNLDQVIEIFKSERMMFKCVSFFNLNSHYKIETIEATYSDKLMRKYAKNFTISKTDNGSLKIIIFDADKDYCYKIASNINYVLDTVNAEIKKQRASVALAALKNHLLNYTNAIYKLEDTVNVLRAEGVNYDDRQIDRLSEAYGKALVNNNSQVAKEIQNKINALSSQTGKLHKFLDDIYILKVEKVRTLIKVNEMELDANVIMPICFVASNAIVPTDAFFPNFWILWLTLSFSIFVFIVVVVVIKESRF